MDRKNMNPGSPGFGPDEPAPPGTTNFTFTKKPLKPITSSPLASPSSPGMLNAKKKLRAFSIQKKSVIASPITVPKPVTTGSTTVLIGKLSGVKVTPKPEPDPDVKKPPKPPKPGNNRRVCQETYTDLQKKNVAEIEDMKRKMELVELGIPLGLICPTSSSVQAMPTKAMPPIKSFLDPAKVDDLIREAKKAKAEGKDFKFELSKFLPDYDNPFQRKREKAEEDANDEKKDNKEIARKDIRRKSDRYEFKRHNDHRKKDDRDKYKDKSKDRDKKDKGKETKGQGDKSKDDKKEESKKAAVTKEKTDKDVKETDVNLNDYLVCDSWSLDTEEKANSSSPKTADKLARQTAAIPLPNEEKPTEIEKSIEAKEVIEKFISEPVNAPVKVEKLQPVIDSFKYELDSNEDEVLDIFDEETDLDKYANPTVKKTKLLDSPVSMKIYDYDQEPTTADDENFLESVINEIKQEDMSDISQDKGLVEYDMSPIKENVPRRPSNRESVTPELDDRMRDLTSQQSCYSDGYRSSESGYKSRESGYKSDRSDSFRLSVEKELDEALEQNLSKSTVESLETWSFILKICQPLLFRHDKNKCYKETHTVPKLWFTENPRRCTCVKDRAVVYEELETCKMPLVDRVYGCDQILEEPPPAAQQWYPRQWRPLAEPSLPLATDWETEEQPPSKDTRRTDTPRSEEIYLDREYQRFMEAVWPEATEARPDTPPNLTPVKESRKKKKVDDGEEKKKAKKMKMSSEGWSQESDVEEDADKSKKVKDKERRKRKLSAAADTDSDEGRARRPSLKRKMNKKTKAKEAKRRRLSKKYLRKLKEKNKKKKKLAKVEKSDGDSDEEKEKEKKKEKKAKKKKQLKLKKAQKKKKARAKSTSSSSSSSESSSESSSDERRKKKVEKRKKKKEKKRKQSSESTQSEELFDANILKNIKTERLTDDEKRMEFSPRRHGEKHREIINVKELQKDAEKQMEFSPRRHGEKHREIINVKELQNDFVGNNIHIKQERDEKQEKEVTPEIESPVPTTTTITTTTTIEPEIEEDSKVEFKEPEPQSLQHVPLPDPIPLPEETSQCSSQESMCSKEQYEKDESHLRPSSQNSNYSFNDVMASHGYKGDEAHEYQKGEESLPTHGYQKEEDILVEDVYQKEEYEPATYEVYEQMAMAYQSDVASQQSQSSMEPPSHACATQRIETVVGARGGGRGEIKCDWRAGDLPPHAQPHARPSRWGLKPGEVNIVLTGGGEQYAGRGEDRAARAAEPVYRIESLANRSDGNTSMSYDEAYMDTYGAADRLQYGDCFSDARRGTLDDRIHLALQHTVLGDVAKEGATEEEREAPEKGILVSKTSETRAGKRVSFADGYTPGQDSDVEAPPKKKKKARRYGCAWPCPAEHPDHTPLWDALPPPPPPASPPPPPPAAPPPALLAALRRPQLPPGLMADPMLQQQLAHHQQKFDPNSSLPFMPPEPPPGLINFH